MNQKRVNEMVRKYLQPIHTAEGVVKINSGNTREHEITKAAVAFALKQKGLAFFTEIEWALPFRGRADVFAPELEAVFEITHSETHEMLTRKIKSYPPGLIVVQIPSGATESQIKEAVS